MESVPGLRCTDFCLRLEMSNLAARSPARGGVAGHVDRLVEGKPQFPPPDAAGENAEGAGKLARDNVVSTHRLKGDIVEIVAHVDDPRRRRDLLEQTDEKQLRQAVSTGATRRDGAARPESWHGCSVSDHGAPAAAGDAEHPEKLQVETRGHCLDPELLVVDALVIFFQVGKDRGAGEARAAAVSHRHVVDPAGVLARLVLGAPVKPLVLLALPELHDGLPEPRADPGQEEKAR